MLFFNLKSVSLCSHLFPDFIRECDIAIPSYQLELLKIGLSQLSFLLPLLTLFPILQRKHPVPPPSSCIFHKQELSHTFVPYHTFQVWKVTLSLDNILQSSVLMGREWQKKIRQDFFFFQGIILKKAESKLCEEKFAWILWDFSPFPDLNSKR